MKNNLLFSSIAISILSIFFVCNPHSVQAVFSSTPYQTLALPNDDVKAIAVDSSGNIYIGGRFTTVGGTSRTYLAKINSDGTLNNDFNPVITHSTTPRVESLILSADESTLYIGGYFNAVDGTARNYIAAVSTTDAALKTFNPSANGAVNVMKLSNDGNTLYVGGSYTIIYGTSRNYLSAVDISTEAGSLLSFNPNSNNYIYAMALSPSNDVLYFGGNFTTVGGTARDALASVYTATGTLTSFFNEWTNDGIISGMDISLDNTELYIGGSFVDLNGTTRNRAASFTITDENNLSLSSFDPNLSASVYTVALSPDNDTVVFGGYFTTASGSARGRVASYTTATDALQDYNPNMTTAGIYYVFCLKFNSAGNRLYIGGDYPSVGGNTSYQFISVFPGPEVLLSETTQSVAEGGTTDTYTYVLSTQPSDDVVLTIDETTDEVTATPATLTFTDSDWSTPQTITITAIDDDIDEDSETDTITATAASNDTDYNEISIDNVTVTITDNDTAGVTLSETTQTVIEGGTTDTYTVVLDSEPISDVVITIDETTDEVSTSSSTLTFTSANWDSTQTVTVTAIDDDIDEDSENDTITHTSASSDGNYNEIEIDDVTVTVTDNDTAGISVGNISGNTNEASGTATFTVVLDTKPTTNVSIPVSSSDTTEGNVSASTLTFTSANWDTAQTVIVTGMDDNVDDGDISYSAVIAATSSSDPNYNDMDHADISVINDDDDTAGITLSETTQTVAEGGTTDAYTIVLNTEPTYDVVITISDNNNQITESPDFLTFTSANWVVPQTVNVTAVDDTDVESSQNDTIIHAVASSDANYNNISISSVTVTITDNDEAVEEPVLEPEEDEDLNDNGIPDQYEDIDPTDEDAVKGAIESIVGLKKGKIKITYDNNDEVSLKIFSYKKKNKTKIKQISNTGYVAALHPLGKQVKIINILTGDTNSSKKISNKTWTKAVTLKSLKLRKKNKVVTITKNKINKINLVILSLKNNYKLGKKTAKTFKEKKALPNKTKKKKNKILIRNKKNKILKKFNYTKKNKLKLIN